MFVLIWTESVNPSLLRKTITACLQSVKNFWKNWNQLLKPANFRFSRIYWRHQGKRLYSADLNRRYSCVLNLAVVFSSFSYNILKIFRRLREGFVNKCVENVTTLLHARKRALAVSPSDLTRRFLVWYLRLLNIKSQNLNFTEII